MGHKFYDFLSGQNIKVNFFIETEKNKDYLEINGNKIKVLDIHELKKESIDIIILSLSYVNHDKIREYISESYTIFPEKKIGYDYDKLVNEL